MTKLEKYFDYRSNDRMLWCVIPEDRENWKVELVECDSFRRLVMVFLGCWTRRSHWWSAWCIDRALLLMLWQILLALLSFHTRMCTHIFLFLFTYIYIHIIWLVVSTPLKNMKVRLGLSFPIYGKKKPCSKPPASDYINWHLLIWNIRIFNWWYQPSEPTSDILPHFFWFHHIVFPIFLVPNIQIKWLVCNPIEHHPFIDYPLVN